MSISKECPYCGRKTNKNGECTTQSFCDPCIWADAGSPYAIHAHYISGYSGHTQTKILFVGSHAQCKSALRDPAQQACIRRWRHAGAEIDISALCEEATIPGYPGWAC